NILVCTIITLLSLIRAILLIFILFGFVNVTVNWTTGGINIDPLSILLLGAGFRKVGLYGPVLISVAIPLGAIIFMIKRKKWLTSRIENQD
ncbi:MAG TPA: hypothetical protein DCM38_07375, partial [Gammaproteobacteria bacterium]|nr:hypothetical protein [Gammaproteobacteria bacterium]